MKVLGSFRDGRLRRVRSIGVVSVLIVAGLMWIGSAQAVHDTGMFELDGNVVHNAATTPPYDWTSLFGAGGTQLVTPDPSNGPILADTFVDDTDAVDNTYFAGGTKITEAVAPVCFTASATVLNTGRPRCISPPLPGVTPPITLVP